MAILKKISLGILLFALVFVGVSFVLPGSASVSRSTVIAAAPGQIFPYLNNLRAFNEWSPWAEMEPGASYQFEGPNEGVGAKASWEGNTVGKGSQEITASVENNRVEVVLDFAGQSADAFYILEPVEKGTEVTWGFSSDAGFNVIARYMNVMMDRWVGGDYEKGLANLKALVEQSSPDPETETAGEEGSQ